MKASRLFGPVAVIALFVSLGLAQESNSGAIIGVVRDPTGAVVAGATINARNTATNVVREAVSNGDGLYAISGLAPGEYELSARQARFATLTTKVQLAVGQRLNWDVPLRIEAKTDTITVTGEAV
ncbi:MAG TPA: carboxypeptidase-like regulatory domain-containing protein, partial [Terriglobales bacterium]|nr:carboxypeptidase-like regulatory domain-containing protein [Terriglobales bacterium]